VKWVIPAPSDVADVGGHPVVPLLPAHVGGQVARRVGAAELAGPHPHRVIGAATGQPMSIRAENFKCLNEASKSPAHADHRRDNLG
jgi:hypothetical protein